MKLEIEIHPTQAEILRTLLLRPKAKFSVLQKETELSSDHFTFHVKRLLEVGLLEKSEKDYSLTSIGKEFANRMDTDTTQIERQAKIGINIGCVRVNKNGQHEYLIQQRLKNPYYGYYGFVGGKIRWGETIFEAAARELKEETGLEGEFKLVGVKHKMDYEKGNQMLEDKFFFVVSAFNLTGELKTQFEGGKNQWMKKEEIFSIEKLFDGIDDTVKLHEDAIFQFVEKKYVVSGY